MTTNGKLPQIYSYTFVRLVSLAYWYLATYFVDSAFHIEISFWHSIMLAFNDFFEASDGFFASNEFAGTSGELFGHEERLGKEFLDFSGAFNQKLVIVGKFFNTENVDDVLQFFVALNIPLDFAGHFVMFLTDDSRREGGRRRIKRVNSGIDA